MSIGIWELLITIILFACPVMGIIRAVKNNSVLNGILSFVIPIYGVVYFFAAQRKNNLK